MGGWRNFCEKIDLNGIKDTAIINGLKKEAENNFDEYHVYPDSIQTCCNAVFFIAKENGTKSLIIYGIGEDDCCRNISGKEVTLKDGNAKVCALDVANSKIIRSIFDYTNPVSHKGQPVTVGLGDRLGLASPGHIRLIKDKNVFPVLAQQSIRELNLTNRTYDDVLASAVWAVFQEGYKKGFGADGDHLKTASEVQMAIDCGFTMITLDCSDHIKNEITDLSDDHVEKLYLDLPADKREKLEAKYLNRKFKLENISGDHSAETAEIPGGNCNTECIEFEKREFEKIVLTYTDAIDYTINICNDVISGCGRIVDFEMSIDETLTSTSPESHFFVGSELLDAGLDVCSLAPRFCGEFQKGIDYRGDVDKFTREFDIHCKIAKTLGYKISVHSGSDKFMVFPIVGEKTEGSYHIKTAGTNWLEAVRVIALKNPALYRKIHQFALSVLDEAKKYYHISADPKTIPDIDSMGDAKLAGFMDIDDSRQILHITYGIILTEKDKTGAPVFKNDIYKCLNENEDSYYKALYHHIGRHLKLLGAY